MTGKKSCLSLHSNRTNSYLFINGIEVVKFKAKDSEINPILLCLGKILKDFSIDHMEKGGLNRYLCDFSYNYDAIAVDDILDIQKHSLCLMK